MRNVFILCFTAKGYSLAVKMAKSLDPVKYNAAAQRVTDLKQAVTPVFEKNNIIVFIGSAGIAVRAISKLIKHKTCDPAVIVADELGRYVIPLLSGHLGGANMFARELARLMEAVPVITTATDITGVFSIDTFAVLNGYVIANPENIKHISSALLNGSKVGISTEFDIDGALPDRIEQGAGFEIGIYIGDKTKNVYEKTLTLMPKRFHVGIGARKGISYEELNSLFVETLASAGVAIPCVCSLSSIDLKKDEEAIVALALYYNIDFMTYSAEQLKLYESRFEQSDFVRSKTGVGNVCEISAFLSSGKGELIVHKTAKNGMTIAIAKQGWRVAFENLHDRDRL